jgi:DNA-binding SARP family transcriptional activator/tRNA A-37 threonylcarbamoyl transferase component Bud32
MGVDDDGVPVSIGGLRQRRLLALLTIRAGSMVDIGWLAEHLWDDVDRPADTARSIRTYVSRLRSSLPAAAREWIETGPGGYRFSAPPEAMEHQRFAMLRADATRARGHDDPLTAQNSLDEALDLWRGQPFRELEDLAWARGDIEHLASDRLEAMEERWEVSLALGRHTQITGELAAFTSEHGLRERGTRQFALALHRSGRTAEALRVISQYRAELAERSGLEPSSAIVKLEAALLAGDPSLDVDTVGRPLRGYRLLEQAGTGAFSVVWRGVQPSVNREVAIKQIRSELASQPEFIRRFEAEAHLVARIEHPHIVPLIDYWRDPDSAYLVMRWLSGGTLELRLDDGPMTVGETLRLAREIGGALSAAHAQGVVHRDVKSPNILFDEAGNAFLGDFGIALTAQESSGSEAALSQGSPAYASPEQIRRETLGPRADIFSLGVVLFECLTGFLPFQNSRSVEDLVEHQLQTPYPLVSEWRDDVPAAVVDAVAKATSKDAGDRFESVQEFLQALESDTVGLSSQGGASDRVDPLPANPYMGLLAFDDGDADRFFGREALVNELIGRLGGQTLQSRCLVVVGPSGSGKSSVVRAGLVPAIRSGAVAGSDDWFTTTLTPGADPFESLDVALLRIAVNPPPSLVGQLRNGARGVLRGIRRCLGSDDDRLLIVIDQFEEVFTSASPEDANRFLDALSVAVEDPTSPVRLVITLRADYYHRPLEHPAFARVVKETAVEVTPLAGDEMERAIVEPARRLGVEFESGLPARIAAEAAGQPSPLPLLQYTLSELFERRVGNQLTVEAYEAIGGLSGALSARAEELYTGADELHRGALRRVLGHMTSPGAESADLRRRVPVADFRHDPSAGSVLESLGRARLVTFDRDTVTREPTVEVAHEALLREWPRLVDWLAEDVDLLRSAEVVAGAATAWDQGGREESDLYRGGRLDNAIELADTAPDQLRRIDREFIDASRSAAEAVRRNDERGIRRLRQLALGVGVALVVALVAGGIAFVQRNDARAARDRSEEATAVADLATLIRRSSEATDPKLAILLALEAQRVAPGPDSDQALLSALDKSGGLSTIASFPPLAEGPCASNWVGWIAENGFAHAAARNGQMVFRDFRTGDVIELGPMPGDGCGRWYGERAWDRRYAVSGSGDRLWLGPFDGPWEVELELDGSMFFTPRAVGRDRFLLTGNDSVQLVDSRTGAFVGDAIEGLRNPSAFLDRGGEIAVVLSISETSADETSLLVLNPADGSELARGEIPARLERFEFEPEATLGVAATNDGRLLTISLDTAEVVADVALSGGPVYALRTRPDGTIMVMSTGPRGGLEAIDGRTGPLEDESVSLSNLTGGYWRADETLITWDSTYQVDVLDLEAEALVDRRLPYNGVGRVGQGGPTVTIDVDSGVAVVFDDPSRPRVIELATGDESLLDLRTPAGDVFPAVGLTAVPGGFAQVAENLEVGLWIDEEMIDRKTLATTDGVTIAGTGGDGSRVVLGASREDGSTEVHLVELGSGEIRDLFFIETEEVAGAFPAADDGLIILEPNGTLTTYDASGTITDELASGHLESPFGTFDGSHLIALAQQSSSGSSVTITDLDDESVRALPSFGRVENIGFARGGAMLVIQSADGAVNLWDVEAAAFAGTLWNGTGAGFDGPWYDEASDSIWVLTSDEIVRLPLDATVWRQRACEAAGRDLTQDEWDRLVPGGGPVQPSCP